MSDPSLYTYEDPLKGYENLEPLSDEISKDGKSFVNPPSTGRSKAYSQFVAPITNDERGGFDIHIYFLQTDEKQLTFAKKLWERIRREFPELRVYRVWDKPVGPHMVGMFEVNVFNPEQFGAFIAWLVINRGPLSALVHPNTGDAVRDHTQRATWMGEPYPLNVGLLRKFVSR
ncbi:hypothetical protein NA57DRAFT_34418 [Rhizodiscina lignyota]|uniref:Uncharacterized protein n=1 Tax=Rhizodiscina lignyota TaxID=1504668 RepID=A0A9P4ILQ1_9PEZI|nr:hypothetical protein NA57DRAFT_34418 [Rhizodiscina lignyota]